MKDALGAAVFLAVAFFVCVYFSCLMGATISANSHTDNPPNKLQWGAGWECSKTVWSGYLSGLYKPFQ